MRFEQDKQIKLYENLLSRGYKLEKDEDNLYSKIGEFITIPVYYDLLTDNLLCKFYTLESKGKSEPFHLIPLWQVIRSLNLVPSPGDTIEGTFIVGVRKNEITRTLIPSLRLPKK